LSDDPHIWRADFDVHKIGFNGGISKNVHMANKLLQL
jgi:hypothetical protein